MTFLKKLLAGRLGAWLGLYPVFAANEEDRRRIIEAAEFHPNDVY
jgi:hypothetical protein